LQPVPEKPSQVPEVEEVSSSHFSSSLAGTSLFSVPQAASTSTSCKRLRVFDGVKTTTPPSGRQALEDIGSKDELCPVPEKPSPSTSRKHLRKSDGIDSTGKRYRSQALRVDDFSPQVVQVSTKEDFSGHSSSSLARASLLLVPQAASTSPSRKRLRESDGIESTVSPSKSLALEDINNEGDDDSLDKTVLMKSWGGAQIHRVGTAPGKSTKLVNKGKGKQR
jgi:hypothetical protein